MYGSSLRLVTRMPREARIAARDAAAMPFPREETTPPVTKTNLVMGDKSWKLAVYRIAPSGTNREPIHGAASCGFTTSCRVALVWWLNAATLDGEAGRDARAYGLATQQRQHRVDRRALRTARDERAHSHHDLGRLQPVRSRDRLDCSSDRLTRPVDALELREQLGQRHSDCSRHQLGKLLHDLCRIRRRRIE